MVIFFSEITLGELNNTKKQLANFSKLTSENVVNNSALMRSSRWMGVPVPF